MCCDTQLLLDQPEELPREPVLDVVDVSLTKAPVLTHLVTICTQMHLASRRASNDTVDTVVTNIRKLLS